MVAAFIDAHRDRFGVEPMCRVLSEHGVPIAPSTFYAHRSRPPSARAQSDAVLWVDIARIWRDRRLGRRLYGARKVWAQLQREGIIVGRCRVERLMRQHGLSGVRRGRRPFTTRPDSAAARPEDLVQRQFRAARPNELWVVDFERHEALLNRAVLEGRRRRLVAAGWLKLRAA